MNPYITFFGFVFGAFVLTYVGNLVLPHMHNIVFMGIAIGMLIISIFTLFLGVAFICKLWIHLNTYLSRLDAIA
jgi:hypothetical protein